MKFLSYLISFLFLIEHSYAERIIRDTNLKLGLGTNVDITQEADLGLGGANPKLRYNSTSDKWTFTNDGSVFKNLGSGAGGSTGINLLTNESFEDGLTPGWSNTGGTFTQGTYTNASAENTKYSQLVATVAGQYFETTLVGVPDFLAGGGCQGQLDRYATTDAASWKISVLDASSNVLFTSTLGSTNGASNYRATPVLPFVCPTAGSTVRIRVESLAAGTIRADLAHLGSNRNVSSVSVGRFYGQVKFGIDCTYSSSSGSFVDYVDATCTKTTEGSISAAAGDRLGVTIPAGSPAGTYTIHTTYPAFLDVTSTGQTGYTRLVWDTTELNVQLFRQLTANDAAQTASYTHAFTITSALTSSIEVKIQGRVGTASSMIVNNIGDSNTVFTVNYESNDQLNAVTSEASGWFIDVSLGGTNPPASVSTSYVPFTDAAFDMVINSGSAPARIPCSGTNPATGLTCAVGSEQTGVNIPSLPHTGWFDVCAYVSVNNPNGFSITTQWVQTGNADQTILAEGGTRLNSVNNHGGTTGSYPHTNCGSFYFADTSEKTLRFAYESDSATNGLIADRAANFGQRDMRVTVRPSTMNVNRPVLTGTEVTTPGATKPISFSWRGNSSGGINSQVGTVVISGSGSSTYTYNIDSTKVSTAPVCVASAETPSLNATTRENYCVFVSSTTSTVTVACIRNGGGAIAVASAHSVMCHAYGL